MERDEIIHNQQNILVEAVFIILFSFATWHLFGRGKTVCHWSILFFVRVWSWKVSGKHTFYLSDRVRFFCIFKKFVCLCVWLWVSFSFFFFSFKKIWSSFLVNGPFLENCSSRTCGFTGLVSRHSVIDSHSHSSC